MASMVLRCPDSPSSSSSSFSSTPEARRVSGSPVSGTMILLITTPAGPAMKAAASR
jgi:hypothetical protein